MTGTCASTQSHLCAGKASVRGSPQANWSQVRPRRRRRKISNELSMQTNARKMSGAKTDVQFFDVLRAVLFVSLGLSTSTHGICLLARLLSGRKARRARGMRVVRVRRSPGVGLHRKPRNHVLRMCKDVESSQDIVRCGVEHCGVRAETVDRKMLPAVVATTTYEPPVLHTERSVTPVPDRKWAVLAEDDDTLCHFEKKCVQVAIAKMRRGRWRRDAFRSFARECANDIVSGESMGNPVARHNMKAVESWLHSRHAFVWVYEAQNVAHLMEGSVLSKWRLGDAVGSCAGDVVWFVEGHVARVVGRLHHSRGVEGAWFQAPWLRRAAGGGEDIELRSGTATEEVHRDFDGSSSAGNARTVDIERHIIEGVGARRGKASVLRMLPVDLEAPVRVFRDIDFRALAMLEDSDEKVEGTLAVETPFVPPALFTHLEKAWGNKNALTRVLSERWVQTWEGWHLAFEELHGAVDEADKRVVLESQTAKFMKFILDSVTFEAKTDIVRIEELAKTGVVVGQSLGHGNNASLPDSLFQTLMRAGLCTEAFFCNEARRNACYAFLQHLHTIQDSWLDVDIHEGVLRHAVHAGEILRFALKHYGVEKAPPLKDIVIRVYCRFDGYGGTDSCVDMRFSRADLQGETPVIGRRPMTLVAADDDTVTLVELYNETGTEITCASYRPAWRRKKAALRVDEDSDSGRQPRDMSVGRSAKGENDSSQDRSVTLSATLVGKRQCVRKTTDVSDSDEGGIKSDAQDNKTVALNTSSLDGTTNRFGELRTECQPTDPAPPSPHPAALRRQRRRKGERTTECHGCCTTPADRTKSENAMTAATRDEASRSEMEKKDEPDVTVEESERAGAAHVYRVRAVKNGDASADQERGIREKSLQQVAKKIKEHPTVPAVSTHGVSLEGESIFSEGAVVLPQTHCAFKECVWVGASDEELQAHVCSVHAGVLEEVAKRLVCLEKDEHIRTKTQLWSAYNEAIAWKVRSGAPLAALAIDRRCLFNYARYLQDDTIHSLVCMVCARKFPRVATRTRNPIEWRLVSPQGKGFLGLPSAFVREHMSVNAYLSRYGHISEGACVDDGMHLQDKMDEFDDWLVSVPTDEGPMNVLCCPEDIRCDSHMCNRERTACSRCEGPLCGECKDTLEGAGGSVRLPPAALANDMMTFYSPEELFGRKVTILEMICASVCITSMVCFTLEKRYRKERSLDMKAGSNEVRMAARGNATSFPMPWTDVLAQLAAADEVAAEGGAPALPRTGVELAGIVSVILKSGGDDDTAESMSTFVHQALVRRQVVIDLIEGAKARGHRAYRNIDMDAVRQKALDLPDEGVPPEVMRMVPLDDSLEKIQMQKAATPVPRPDGLHDAADILNSTKANAVVCEKSSFDEGDINAQRIEAIRSFVQRLDGACIHTGSDETSNSSEEDGSGEVAGRTRKRSRRGDGISTKLNEPALVASEQHALLQARGEGKRVDRIRVRTGNTMIDQFEPWYFGVAFAFLFKYCTGMPDCPEFMKRPRYRRENGAPRVELPLWVRIMSRRVESQISRDWHFGFVSWNLVFRSAVNLSKTWFTYASTDPASAEDQLTPEQIGEGAKQIYKALDGKYLDVNNKPQKVKGDITKVRHVPTLGKAAHKLLTHIEHTSRRLPGTQEARRVMRFETNALRVRYGVPIFVTFSPDEAHSLLMVRLSRVRKHDPVHKSEDDGDCSRWTGEREWPSVAPEVDEARMAIPVEKVFAKIPSWSERRKVLAQDPMASVDGFRILVDATLRHLFGVRTCPDCPRCNEGDTPCQDLFGSNAVPGGGIFGRVDAYFVSIEAQKSIGSLHAHCQVFIQCLHQHTPLQEVFEIIRDDVNDRGKQVMKEYLEYKERVCRQVYSERMDADVIDKNLDEAEKSWPEFKTEGGLLCRPTFQTRTLNKAATQMEARQDADVWETNYLHKDVQYLQERKQHHVHLKDEETGDRVPLPACRRKDNPKLCKADYPRTSQIIDTAIVVCPGRAIAMDMPKAGRRNRVGSLHGPMNHANLNGTHPCMLSAQRFNSDVQLPFRFPITKLCCTCGKACDDKLSDAAIIKVAQIAQDAQAGYACDYCTKRQPMAFHEVKECCKGIEKLGRQLQGETTNRFGKRVANRIMSDAYGKGIVRGQVECANLRAFARTDDVTAAESLKSCETTAFYGREYVDLVERLADGTTACRKAQFAEVDMRDVRRRKVTIRDVGSLYGLRPNRADLWQLSPYEFATYWTPTLLSFPTRVKDAKHPRHHAVLTKEGEERLKYNAQFPALAEDLTPGVHYVVKEDGGEDWVPYPDTPGCAHLRHTWVLKRNRRPKAPTFFGAPLPRGCLGEAERSARIVMTYFHPWTLRQDFADKHVVFAGDLRGEAATWNAAMTAWLDGNVQTEESARYVGNFMSVYRVRPQDADGTEERSDEDVSDVELDVGFEQLDEALKSRVGGKRRKDGDGDSCSEESDAGGMQGPGGMSHYDNSKGGMTVAQKAWGLRDGETPLSEVQGAWPVSENCDVEQVLAGARKSRTEEQSMTDRIAQADGAVTMAGSAATSEEIRTWLRELQIREDAKTGRRVVNAKQYEMVKKVAYRVICENDAESDGNASMGQPLQWCMHGGPGTGKSHVLRIIREELFEGLMKWTIGVHFQITALQAVMAQLLGGDTIHHACGIPAIKRGEEKGEDVKLQYETAKRVLQWRWLFIDEISMVSARLLAEVDVKLRGVIRDVGTTKCGDDGLPRPFGGLNIVLSGDFWQLAPPDGGFLADVPSELVSAARKYTSLPPVLHGQSLLWGGAERGIQGVTELEECERCDDVWLKEVQDEFRRGALSEDSHAFLHGRDTSVPGSWLKGDVLCKNQSCRELCSLEEDATQMRTGQRRKRQVSPQDIRHGECNFCRDERGRRRLVLEGPNDSRLLLEKFLLAPGVFPNNDVKYEANKVRASQYARKHKKPMVYVPARDTPTPEALRERPDLPQQKMAWLQRHDKESGNLYGFLPIAEGMPVALTDHIDRNEEKNLLRGRVGHVHSWICDGVGEDDQITRGGETILKKTPKIIFVLFDEGEDEKGERKPCKWTIDGLCTPGLYPVTPQKKDWFVDKGRLYPRLKVKRRQFPLAPAFGVTAHAAQGQTFKRGVIVDLSIGGGTSPLSSYVALTRVRRREDMLIFRPFDRSPYTMGERKGPALLLKCLRGEHLDWNAIEKEFMPSGKCTLCSVVKYKNQYRPNQWSREDNLRVCDICLEDKKSRGTPWQCMECRLWKSQAAFGSSQSHHTKLSVRRCLDCPERRKCRVCDCRKYENGFLDYQWDRAGNSRGTGGMCIDCQESKRQLKCSRCGHDKVHDDFPKPERQKDEPTCKDCVRCLRKEEKMYLEQENMEVRGGKKSQKKEKTKVREEKRDQTKGHMRVRVCSRCKVSKSEAEFSVRMLKHGTTDFRVCSQCVNAATADATMREKDPVLCSRCGESKSKAEFSAHMLNHTTKESIVCRQCTDTAKAAAMRKEKEPALCSRCGKSKSKTEFSAHTLKHATTEHIVCSQCVDAATVAATKREKEEVLCPRCEKFKKKAEFSAHMLHHASKSSIACIECVNVATAAATRKEKGQVLCQRCGKSKSKAEFSAHMLNHTSGDSIACSQCVDAATAAATMKEKEPVLCSRCRVSKSKAEFSNHMLKHTSKDSIMCRQCVDDETTRRIQLQRGQRLQRGQWKCVECKEHLDREHFSKWLAPRSTQRSDGKQRCNVCYDGQDLKRKEVAERSHASVVKKPRVR